jgi:hypothetical protein
LKRVRDKSENGMAVIGAVRTLENLAEEAEQAARRGEMPAPGLRIVLVHEHRGPPPPRDVTPVPQTIEGHAEPVAQTIDAEPLLPVPYANNQPAEPPEDPTIFRALRRGA